MTGSRQQGIRNTVAILFGLALLFVGGLVYTKLNPPLPGKDELKQHGLYLFDKARILNEFALVDHNEQAFTLDNLKGQWSFIFFGFTFCPDICPTTMQTMNQFVDKLEGTEFADDTKVILVSVDPARDTPAVLKPYVEYFNPDFVGVTGDFFDLHRFATQLNTTFRKVPGGDENYQVDHGANLAIINPYGHFHGFVKPPLDPGKLLFTYESARALFDAMH